MYSKNVERIEADCCIAGGGPAGIMLGYLLARTGVDVVVLEKWPDFFRDFRGDTIHPSTMDLLHELGLLEEFLKLPHNEMTRMTLHIGDDTVTLADFRHMRARCPFIAFIPQWDFLNFLADKGRQFPSFRLMMATEALDVLREGGRVVGVRAKSKSGEHEIHSKLVVGADGRHSTIREKVGYAVEDLGVPIDVLWFRVSRTDKDDQQSLGRVDGGRILVMLDRREYWQCAYVIKKDSFETIQSNGLDAFKAHIAETAHMDESALREVDSWDKVKLLSVTVDHVKEWAREGVLVIGDAAHAMSPIGGVGINYAIQDAVAAANVLIPAFRDGGVSLPVLARIQARREKAVRRMQKFQVYVQDKILGAFLGNPGKGMPWFFRVFNWFPILRRIPAHFIGYGFQTEHLDRSSSAIMGR